MSFNLFRTNPTPLTDIKTKYKQIANDFCRQYYNVYDENFNNLIDLYCTDSQFTYLDQEFIGFSDFLQKIRNLGIHKFFHNNLNITAQPIGDNYLLICIIGQVTINSTLQNKFMETIYVQVTNDNKLKVGSTIFKLLD